MQGMGKRLRARARALDLSDSEVARRVDLSQPRYANYVNDANEPDLGTFVRICRALAMTPDEVLGFREAPQPSERDLLKARVDAATMSMATSRLRIAAALLDVLAGMPESI